MTFTPALPLTGYAGWTFLKRTAVVQKAVLNAQPEIKRDEAYFREKIGKIDTAAELVADRRLLKVALGAFGLENDINSKAFIQKVLEGGSLNSDGLASKLADKQYLKLSAAFGFGDFSTPRNKLSDFPEKIISAYKTRSFEVAVGEQNDDLRLAMNAEREVAELAAKSSSSNDARWYSVLGSTPLRRVFEKALGLPTSFATLDIDKQLAVMKDKAKSQLGSDQLADFTDAASMEKLLRRFLIRSEAEAYRNQFGSSAAVSLMSNAVAFSRAR
ncbi:MAG: DUF1217 domain-containing protein [Rhodobacteraceae bacterium]|nr:DUF1217 domain-containing protein [Paracoccaceae bacterium]